MSKNSRLMGTIWCSYLARPLSGGGGDQYTNRHTQKHIDIVNYDLMWSRYSLSEKETEKKYQFEAKMFRNLGVCHSDDIFYLWDMFGLNAETGVVDTWWSEDNKLNSRR